MLTYPHTHIISLHLLYNLNSKISSPVYILINVLYHLFITQMWNVF